MLLTKLLILSLLLTLGHCDLFDDWPWKIVHRLRKVITVGDSMKGKTIDQFQPGKNQIEPAGVMDNHSKWVLRIHDTEEEDGHITVPLLGVKAGTREAFASRKRDYAFLGSEVRYSYIIDDDIMLHFMYDVPWMRYFGNTLSIALCEKANAKCRLLKAKDMHDNDYPFLKRKCYKDDIAPIAICYDNLCFVASMGLSGRPVIQLAILPMFFHDLEIEERKKIVNVSSEIYNDFMKKLSIHFAGQ